MKKIESRLKLARGRAFIDISVGLLSTSIGLRELGGEVFCLLVAGAWYLFTGQSCPEQTDHNDFEVREYKNPGYFVLFSGSVIIFLLVFSGIAHVRVLPDERKEESFDTNSNGRSVNYSVLCFCCSWAFAARGV